MWSHNLISTEETQSLGMTSRWAHLWERMSVLLLGRKTRLACARSLWSCVPCFWNIGAYAVLSWMGWREVYQPFTDCHSSYILWKILPTILFSHQLQGACSAAAMGERSPISVATWPWTDSGAQAEGSSAWSGGTSTKEANQSHKFCPVEPVHPTWRQLSPLLVEEPVLEYRLFWLRFLPQMMSCSPSFLWTSFTSRQMILFPYYKIKNQSRAFFGIAFKASLWTSVFPQFSLPTLIWLCPGQMFIYKFPLNINCPDVAQSSQSSGPTSFKYQRQELTLT